MWEAGTDLSSPSLGMTPVSSSLGCRTDGAKNKNRLLATVQILWSVDSDRHALSARLLITYCFHTCRPLTSSYLTVLKVNQRPGGGLFILNWPHTHLKMQDPSSFHFRFMTRPLFPNIQCGLTPHFFPLRFACLFILFGF